MIEFLAAVGAVHLLIDASVIGFLVWFTYDSRQTAKKLDEEFGQDDSN